MRIEVQVVIARDGKPGKTYRLVPVVHPAPYVQKAYLLRSAEGEYKLEQLCEPRRDGRRQLCSCTDARVRNRRCKHLVCVRAMGWFDPLLEPSDLGAAPPVLDVNSPADETVEVETAPTPENADLVGAGAR